STGHPAAVRRSILHDPPGIADPWRAQAGSSPAANPTPDRASAAPTRGVSAWHDSCDGAHADVFNSDQPVDSRLTLVVHVAKENIDEESRSDHRSVRAGHGA